MNGQHAVIVDTGPLVALANIRDDHYGRCLSSLKSIGPNFRLLTISPVITEALFLLSGYTGTREHLFSLLDRLGVQLIDIKDTDLARIRQLMAQYEDLPMDFADACIVTLAENLNVTNIFTLDQRDFSVYRPKHVKNFKMLP